jgi:hypothetical protein
VFFPCKWHVAYSLWLARAGFKPPTPPGSNPLRHWGLIPFQLFQIVKIPIGISVPGLTKVKWYWPTPDWNHILYYCHKHRPTYISTETWWQRGLQQGLDPV